METVSGARLLCDSEGPVPLSPLTMITIGRPYVYYRTDKHGALLGRLPCVVCSGPFYRNTREARWEIQIPGEARTRFVGGYSLVAPEQDAAGVRRYEARRDRSVGQGGGGPADAG